MNRLITNVGFRTLVRWGAAALIGLVAVSQAVKALPGLLARSATLGAFALGSLALLTVLGMVSLWLARVRIGRELVGLAARPATGDLVAVRKARLTVLAANGGVPNRDALAEATAAEERGHAYLGRYLVAVAVLIGLVGTFSGLAEALRGLPAILNGSATDPTKLAGLLGAPLAGLDVTFAAGIVGILATLALALAQGDLQIHEELALARLEEETNHELIPALWPASHSVEERMVRELSALREENRTMLVEAGAAIGARVAEVSARSTSEVASRLTAAVQQNGQQLVEAVERRFKELLSAHAENAVSLHKTGDAQLASMRTSGKALLDQLGSSAEALQKQFATGAAAQTAALLKAGEAHALLATELRTRANESATTLSAQLEALQSELAAQAELTQHMLTTDAARANAESHAAWQSLRNGLVESINEERLALVGSITGLRDTLGHQIDGSRIALEGSSIAVLEGLTRASDKHEQQLAALQTAAVEAMSHGLADAQRSIGDAAAQTTRALAESSAQAQQSLTEATKQANELMSASVTRASLALTDSARALTEAATQELGETRMAIVDAATHATDSLASALMTGTERLEALLLTNRTELSDTLAVSREAIDRLVSDSVGALTTSASTLSQSTETLAKVSESLTPQLEALSPELRALTQEVALLGSRNDHQAEPLFADELLRLGEGMERLEALVRLAQSGNELHPVAPEKAQG